MNKLSFLIVIFYTLCKKLQSMENRRKEAGYPNDSGKFEYFCNSSTYIADWLYNYISLVLHKALFQTKLGYFCRDGNKN